MTILPLQERVVVLATKLTHPRLPTALVARDRLLVDLNNALSHRLTLVSASAGWGKTTLLSAWVSASPHLVAWASLDELDNDPSRFWIALIAALRTRLPEVGALALAMLQSPQQPPLTTVLTALLNELASGDDHTPIVLLVDDYHVITDPAVHESLTFLLEHLPAHMHGVLATRVDPDLPLARWRVRGDLLEIRTTDLRFTASETSSFFMQTLGDVLAGEDVQRLEQRSEGWIAGLQLAALALRQREDRSVFVQTFTGNHRYLLDYVQAEVLARQEPHVQRFLMQIAVLRCMNAGLCTALTSVSTSQAMLDLLERNNLFLLPLDDERHWYRMHDLFREVMLARLQATDPESIPQLHGRAARWYAAQDEMHEAIAHALAAHDFDYAAEVIERAAPQMWLRGEARTVHGWLRALPNDVVQQHAHLVLDAALSLFESFQSTVTETYRTIQTEVEQLIARIEAILGALPAAEVTLLQRRISLLRALIATRVALTSGDSERMRLLAEQSTRLSEGEEGTWKLIGLWITFWYVESIQRDGALLIPQLLAAKQQVVETGNHLEIVRIMRWLAFVYLRAGRFHLMREESLQALAVIQRIGQHAATTGYFYYYLAWGYYVFNELDKAASAAQRLLQIAQTWQQADQLMVGNDVVVSLALIQADYASAEQALLANEALIQQERFATHTSAVLTARVEFWLATGNLEAASAWAEQVVFAPETWNPNRKWEFLTWLRVQIAQGQYERVLATIQQFSAYLDRPGDIGTSILFLSLQVVALHGARQHAQAQTVLMRLLALTAEENYIRVFLDAGESMHHALQQLRDQADDLAPPVMAFVSQLLAAFAQEAQNGEIRRDAPPPALRSTLERSNALREPLTWREREVLRLLLGGASNAEIAAALVISVATAKKHVSNLLGKLGVATRAQAIARTRELSYLVEP